MTRSRSYIATPPGATIKEQLDDRGMSQKEFASRMEMSEKHISRLLSGSVQLTPGVAYRLEMVLGLPAKFWCNLESIYRQKLAKVEDENAMDIDKDLAKKFPYGEMAKNGWVLDTQKAEERVVNLRKFFEVARLESLSNDKLIPRIACRRLSITKKSDFALIAWAQKAKVLARETSVSQINLNELTKQLPTIRAMTQKDPSVFCPALIKLLSDCGIALIFLPHISGSFLHGATFYDKNKIVVGLTVRGKDADKFWFSLFHEIGHILLGHLNQDGELGDAEEDAANKFARDILISPKQFHAFVDENRGRFTKTAIRVFSEDIGIDPGIVVGRLQKEGYIKFEWLNDLKTKYKLTT